MTDEIKPDDRMAHWTKDADGNIDTHSLISYEPRSVAGMFGLLRIEYIHSPEMIDRPDSLQLAMTPAQMDQLGQDLLKMAAKLMASPQSRNRSH